MVDRYNSCFKSGDVSLSTRQCVEEADLFSDVDWTLRLWKILIEYRLIVIKANSSTNILPNCKIYFESDKIVLADT